MKVLRVRTRTDETRLSSTILPLCTVPACTRHIREGSGSDLGWLSRIEGVMEENTIGFEETRGPIDSKLAIGDDALGFWKTLLPVFSTTRGQYFWSPTIFRQYTGSTSTP